ncbi:unnamed protein product [Rhizoctonia solani]|uniref:Uncharacterized protein n=1 Tax=Rhizoctonia solani TaxID=456999 RepID=A0A8H2XDH2_9AGAM|nr:unnamed protein product [Rhizoctonia solani]
MTRLRPGRYNLLILNSNEVDLLPSPQFATAVFPEKPVLLRERQLQGQLWIVTIVEDGEKQIIELESDGMNKDDITFLHEKAIEPGVPLVLSSPRPFEAKHEKDIGSMGVYSLIIPDGNPLFTWYVGRNQDQEVAVERVPIMPIHPPHSVWGFDPIRPE